MNTQWGSLNKNVEMNVWSYNILEIIEVASVVDKMVESHLRWFEHVQRRELDETVKIVDQMV